MDILYIDNHLFIVNKPAGMLVQGDQSGDVTLLEYAKQYIKSTFKKPGAVFLGLVHRLDRPVSGVLIFARTSKAAARLSDQIRKHQFRKEYWALVEGIVPENGQFVDYLRRNNRRAEIGNEKSGKYSELIFKRLGGHAGISLVEIVLITGRYHQIRAQFASRSYPIVGDLKYGAKKSFDSGVIALHARSTSFSHPVRNEILTITSKSSKSWTKYTKLIEKRTL